MSIKSDMAYDAIMEILQELVPDRSILGFNLRKEFKRINQVNRWEYKVWLRKNRKKLIRNLGEL